MPGAEPSIAGNASTSESEPRCQPAGAVGADDARHRAQLRRDRLRVAAVLDEDVERLHHAGADVRRRRASAGRAIAVPAPGNFASCASFGFSFVPAKASAPTIAMPGGGDRDRAAEHEPRPAAPGAVLGTAAVDEPLRHARGRC